MKTKVFRYLRNHSMPVLAPLVASISYAQLASAQAPTGDTTTDDAAAGQADAADDATVEAQAAAEDAPAARETDDVDTQVSSGDEPAEDDTPGSEQEGEETQARPEPTAQEYAALEARLAALEEAQLQSELQQMGEEEALASARQDALRIYGFLDMGLQRVWVDESTIIAGYLDTNATTFAMGNIDFYFDANPHPDWRGLAEIRFTNAPRGRINTFGGIAGTFQREDTYQFDPGGTVPNAPIWLGGVIVERAWVEWNRYQSVRIRTGNFFTPFGIWNVDHGQPTLISAVLPQFIQQLYFPLRQTGVQALGSFFAKDLEFAYRAWVTNGREEINNLDFTDDKATGARVFVRKDVGDLRYQFGSSLHHGRVANKVVNITGVPPATDDIEFDVVETVAYYETSIGLDTSIDINDTRIRAEGVATLQIYEDGKRGPPAVETGLPSSRPADDWRYAGYLLIAQRLPWWGLEPYVYGELIQYNRAFPDGMAIFAPGFNVHFNPSAMLKVQGSRGWVFDWTEDHPGDASRNNNTSLVGRVVLAF